MFGVPEKHIDQMIERNDENVAGPVISLIEECGELIAALSKFESKRIQYDPGIKKIKEELAHVLISANVMARMYNITELDIVKEVILKAVKNDYDISDYGYKPKERDI